MMKFKDKKFKIMQIADVQERLPINPDTLKLIDLAIRKEMPDLIVFTGDQIAGYYPCFKKNTQNAILSILKAITKTADELTIPYCVTFGNHDSDSGMSNREQFEKLYKTLPGLVHSEPRNSEDTGTFALSIKDSSGEKDALAIYLFDSNKKGKNGVYMPVSKEQIEWYKSKRDELKKQNGAYLPAIVFQHIPIPEYYSVIKRANRFTKGAVEAFDDHKGEYYVLAEKKPREFMYESPATPTENTGEFEAFCEKGDVIGFFCGHDHNNSFVTQKNRIRLGYTQGCGFNTYGPGDERGVRVFVFDEDDIRNFETYTVTMRDFGKCRPSKPMLEAILSNMPSSPKEVKKILLDASAFAVAVAVIYKIIRR